MGCGGGVGGGVPLEEGISATPRDAGDAAPADR